MTSLEVLQEVQQMLEANKPREEICALIQKFTSQQRNLPNVHVESTSINADAAVISEDRNKDVISTLVTVLPINDQVDCYDKKMMEKEKCEEPKNYQNSEEHQAQATDTGKLVIMHSTSKFIATPNTIVTSPVWACRDDEGNPLSSTEQIETFMETDTHTRNKLAHPANVHTGVDSSARRSSLCSTTSLHSRSERHELSMYVNSTFSREVDRSAHSLAERHLSHSLSEISLNHRSTSTSSSSSSTSSSAIINSMHSSSPESSSSSTRRSKRVIHSCQVTPTCVTQTKNNCKQKIRMNSLNAHKRENAAVAQEIKQSTRLISPLHLPSSEVEVQISIEEDNSKSHNINSNVMEKEQRRLCHSDSSLMRMSKITRNLTNAPREFAERSKMCIPSSASYSPEMFPTSTSTSTSLPTQLMMHNAITLSAPSLTAKSAAAAATEIYCTGVDENEKPLSWKYRNVERHSSGVKNVQPALPSTLCENVINQDDNVIIVNNDDNNENVPHYANNKDNLCKEDGTLFEEIAQMSGHSTKWCAQPTLHSTALSHYSKPLSTEKSETCEGNNNNINNDDDKVSFVTSTYDSRRSSVLSVNTPLYHKKWHVERNKNEHIAEQEYYKVTVNDRKDMDHKKKELNNYISVPEAQGEETLESVHGDASAECGHSILALSSLESEVSTPTTSLSYTSVTHVPRKTSSTEYEEEEEEQELEEKYKVKKSINVSPDEQNEVYDEESQIVSEKLPKQLSDEVNNINSEAEISLHRVNVSAPSCKVKMSKSSKPKSGKQLRNGKRFMPPFVLDSKINKSNINSEIKELYEISNAHEMKNVAILPVNDNVSVDDKSATHRIIRANEKHQENVQHAFSINHKTTYEQEQGHYSCVNDNITDNNIEKNHINQNNGISLPNFQPIIRFARLFVRRTDPFLPTSQVKKMLADFNIPFMSELDITCASGVITQSVHLKYGIPSSVNVFTLAEKYGGAAMLYVNTCMNVLLRYSFSVAFTFDCGKLLLFLKRLSTYLVESNPFHNYLHAVDVILAAHEWLCDSAAVIYCSDEELFSFLFAALICNVAHCGIDESTMEALNHPFTLIARGSLPPQQGAILSLVGALLDEDEMHFLPTTSVSWASLQNVCNEITFTEKNELEEQEEQKVKVATEKQNEMLSEPEYLCSSCGGAKDNNDINMWRTKNKEDDAEGNKKIAVKRLPMQPRSIPENVAECTEVLADEKRSETNKTYKVKTCKEYCSEQNLSHKTSLGKEKKQSERVKCISTEKRNNSSDRNQNIKSCEEIYMQPMNCNIEEREKYNTKTDSTGFNNSINKLKRTQIQNTMWTESKEMGFWETVSELLVALDTRNHYQMVDQLTAFMRGNVQEKGNAGFQHEIRNNKNNEKLFDNIIYITDALLPLILKAMLRLLNYAHIFRSEEVFFTFGVLYMSEVYRQSKLQRQYLNLYEKYIALQVTKRYIPETNINKKLTNTENRNENLEIRHISTDVVPIIAENERSQESWTAEKDKEYHNTFEKVKEFVTEENYDPTWYADLLTHALSTSVKVYQENNCEDVNRTDEEKQEMWGKKILPHKCEKVTSRKESKESIKEKLYPLEKCGRDLIIVMREEIYLPYVHLTQAFIPTIWIETLISNFTFFDENVKTNEEYDSCILPILEKEKSEEECYNNKQPNDNAKKKQKSANRERYNVEYEQVKEYSRKLTNNLLPKLSAESKIVSGTDKNVIKIIINGLNSRMKNMQLM